MDLIDQIKTEQKIKGQLAAVFSADQVEFQYSILLDRKRINALKTAESVLIILKEMQKNGPAISK